MTSTSPRRVAIGFDDGPDFIYTERVLDLLRVRKARATFFICGDQYAKDSEKAEKLLTLMLEDGHEIGFHTHSHLHLKGDKYGNDTSIDAEIDNDVHLIGNFITRWKRDRPTKSCYPAVLFRPPYGEYNNHVLEVLRKNDLKLVTWHLNPSDWDTKVRSTAIRDFVVKEVDNRAKGGNPQSVVVLHDGSQHEANGRDETIKALDEIIFRLQNKSFKFVPISEISGGSPLWRRSANGVSVLNDDGALRLNRETGQVEPQPWPLVNSSD